MKFDKNIAVAILKKCETECDGLNTIENNDIQSMCTTDEEFISYCYHVKILKDEGMIEGIADCQGGSTIPSIIIINHVTLAGHEYLKNNKKGTARVF